MNYRSVYFKAFIAAAAIVFGFCDPVKTEIVQLTSQNLNETLAAHKFAVVTFYTDWCSNSRKILETFREQKDVIDEMISENNNVVVGRVNCEYEESICDRYKIRYVPHIKILTNGSLALFEYVGAVAGAKFLKNIKQVVDVLN